MASKPKPKAATGKLKPVTALQVEAVLTRARTQVEAKRQLLGLSRPQLADLIGRTESTITKMERGERDGSISAWLKISMALDLSMAQLFGSPAEAISTGARDRRTAYAGEHSSPTDAQLAALQDAARKLDTTDLADLIKSARRLGRDRS